MTNRSLEVTSENHFRIAFALNFHQRSEGV